MASRWEVEDAATIVSLNSPTKSKVLRLNEAAVNNLDLQTSSIEMQKSLEEWRKNVSRHLREVVVIIVMDAHPKIVNKQIISNIRLSTRTKNTLKNAKSRGSRVTIRRAACSTRPKSANTSTWFSIQTIS